MSDGYVPFALDPLPNGATELAIDIQLPPPPSKNTELGWVGDFQASLSIPSIGVFNQYLGRHDLAFQPLGLFGTVKIELPPELRNKLQLYTMPDVQLNLALNVTSELQGIAYLDNIRFTGSALVKLTPDLPLEPPVADHQSVFSFENEDDWFFVRGMGSVMQEFATSEVTDGKASLRIFADGWNLLESRPFHTRNLSKLDSIVMDIFVPERLGNVYWAGALDFHLHAPSANVYNQYIGHVELNALPRGQYSTISLAIPDPLKAVFENDVDDVRLRIAINSAPGSGAFYIDNIRKPIVHQVEAVFEQGANQTVRIATIGSDLSDVILQWKRNGVEQSPLPYPTSRYGWSVELPSCCQVGDRIEYRVSYKDGYFGGYTAWKMDTVFAEVVSVWMDTSEIRLQPYSATNSVVAKAGDSKRYSIAVFRDYLRKREKNLIEACGNVLSVMEMRKDVSLYNMSSNSTTDEVARCLMSTLPQKFYNIIALPEKKTVIRAESTERARGDSLDVVVECQDDLDSLACRQLVESHGVRVVRFGWYIKEAVGTIDDLNHLAAEDQILGIFEKEEEKLLMQDVRNLMGVEALREKALPGGYGCTENNWLGNLPYTGLGVDVGVSDHLIDSSLVRFKEGGSLRSFMDWNYKANYIGEGHGNCVASIIGGSGCDAVSAANQGIAPRVRFYSYSISKNPDFEKGHVVNHSHTMTNYIPFGRATDMALHLQKYQDLKRKTIVYAAGNEGLSLNNDSTEEIRNKGWSAIEGFYSITAAAKNPITVGNVDKALARNVFSSMGPTIDGRLKPDLVAIGTDVDVALPLDSGRTWSGTSMSAPAVTGVAALMLEKQRNSILRCPKGVPCAAFDSLALRNSTVKAMLIHTATDLQGQDNGWNIDLPAHEQVEYGAGPDFSTGWGFVNAEKALSKVDKRYYREVKIEPNEHHELTFAVPANRGDLQFTVAWDDIKNGGISTSEKVLGRPLLINDIDIYLESPSGKFYYPWKIRPLLDSNSFGGLPFFIGKISGKEPLDVARVREHAAYRNCVDNQHQVMPDLDWDCFDHLNNVEKVTVDAADVEAGMWKAHLIGRKVESVVIDNKKSGALQPDSPDTSTGQYVSVVSDYTLEESESIRGLYLSVGGRQPSCRTGYEPIEVDLNRGSGGKFIYLCYTRNPSAGDPIRSVMVWGADYSIDQVPDSYENVLSNWYPHGENAVDLNSGAGGKFIYLYQSRDPSHGDPIESVNVWDHDSPDFEYLPSWVKLEQDLNDGAGGRFLNVAYRKNRLGPITDLFIRTGNAANLLCPSGYERKSMDLNKGSGGTFQFLCVSYDPYFGDPITDIKIKSYSQNAEDTRPVGYSHVRSTQYPDGKHGMDLNRGADGKFVYMYLTRQQNQAFIEDISVLASRSASVTSVDSRYVKINVDLNAGAGGSFIYLFYRRQEEGP